MTENNKMLIVISKNNILQAQITLNIWLIQICFNPFIPRMKLIKIHVINLFQFPILNWHCRPKPFRSEL